MNSTINSAVALLLLFVASAGAQTAVLFGASGAVGSEVLKSLLVGSFFHEVILIGRKSYPKVDEILSTKKAGAPPNFTTVTLSDLTDLDSYDGIASADACFIAVGIGNINAVTLEYLLSIEVDLIGTIARFCDKIGLRTLSLLSEVDADYDTAIPFSEAEIDADDGRSMGWAKGIYLYHRVKGLEEKSAIANAGSVPHIRLFRPSSIVTKESRYGWVDRFVFFFHYYLDPYLPANYHSVDVRLLGMAMVADAEQVLSSSVEEYASETHVAKVMYADYVSVAGEAFEKQHSRSYILGVKGEAIEPIMSDEH